MNSPSIAILADYSPANPQHLATEAAIAHSNSALGLAVQAEWVATDTIDASVLQKHSGIWISTGSPYRDMAKVLWAIQQARENGIPCLGTCGGMQHIIIEYARNVLGFKDAQHAEYDPCASTLFISELVCSLAGRRMDLRLEAGSRVAGIYGSTSAAEEYFCNFGVHPDRTDILRSGPLKIVGADAEGEIRVVELPDHPFFVGTLFVPQARSSPSAPHPLVSALVSAVAEIR